MLELLCQAGQALSRCNTLGDTTMLWVGVLVLCLSVRVVGCFQCPNPCRCFNNFDAAGTITVDCRGQDLFEIPFPIPPETSSL